MKRSTRALLRGKCRLARDGREVRLLEAFVQPTITGDAEELYVTWADCRPAHVGRDVVLAVDGRDLPVTVVHVYARQPGVQVVGRALA